MDPRLSGALIMGAGGALGGHLVDRERSSNGSWFDRNKGAVIGSIGGGLIGSGLGYYAGNLKIARKLEDEERLKRHMTQYDKNTDDIVKMASPIINSNKAKESLAPLREKAYEDAKNVYMNKDKYSFTKKDINNLGLLSAGLGAGFAVSGGVMANNLREDKNKRK